MLVAQRELHRQETTLRLTSDQRNDKVIKLYTSCSRQTQDFHTPTTVQTRCRLPYPNHPTTHILKKKEDTHKVKVWRCIQYGMIFCFTLQSEIKSSTTVRMKSCASCINCSRTQRHGYDRKNYTKSNSVDVHATHAFFLFSEWIVPFCKLDHSRS